jgi:beta-N-acetylhexosaminidase
MPTAVRCAGRRANCEEAPLPAAHDNTMDCRKVLIASITLAACAPVVSRRPADATRSSEAAGRYVGSPAPGTATAPPPADARWVAATLASLSLREKVAQLIMPWVPGEYAAVGSPEYEQLRKWVQDDGVGGLVMSIGLPHSYAAKLNHMQRLARVPLLVASDMENGSGMRLGNSYALPSLLPQGGGTVFPPVMALGATGSEELAFELGRVTGKEARAVGVHLTFGPVLDVNSNPLNPIINTRSFGEDPRLVARLASAYIRGARTTGLMTTGKHFPGHGDTDVDSHIELPAIRGDRPRLEAVDLPPFRAAIVDGVDGIMTAHIAAVGILGPDAPPATLSSYFMTDLLRSDMHFTGLLVTDAMTMGGVAKRYGAAEPLILAIEAGADVLLMPRNVEDAIDTVLGAVGSGRIKESRIDDSVRRILVAKAKAGLRTGRLVSLDAIDGIVNIPEHAAVARQVAERSITLARDEGSLIPLSPSVTRILSITYADASDLTASRVFDEELRAAGYVVNAVLVDSRTTEAEYLALGMQADSASLIIASAYVSPREGRGSISAATGLPAFVERVSLAKKPIIGVSFGTPYLLNSFPSVPTYVLAWGGAPVSQRAAAAAIIGRNPITGRLPVSLPPFAALGAGITRPGGKSRGQ